MASRDRSFSDPELPILGGVLLTGLFLAGSFGLLYSVAAIKAAFQHVSLHTAFDSVKHDLITLTLVQLGSMGAALFVGLRWFGPDATLGEAVSANPVSLRTLGLCFCAGLFLQFPLSELSNLTHEWTGANDMASQLAIKNMIEPRSLWQGFLVVLCLVFAIPACEELLFRGLLLSGMAKRRGIWVGLIASSCLFGASHGLVNAIYAFGGGLILGRVFLWTRSVYPGIAMHAAINSLPVLLPERAVGIHGFNVPSQGVEHIHLWLWIPSLAAAIALLAWVRRLEYQPGE